MSLNVLSIRDDFKTDVSSGGVTGTVNDTGQTRTVGNNPESQDSISSGELVLAARVTPTIGSPTLYWNSAARAPGLIFIANVKRVGPAMFGWATTVPITSGTHMENGVIAYTTTPYIYNGLTGPIVASATVNQYYKWYLALRSIGCQYFVKGGSEYGYPTLVWIDSVKASPTLYPVLSNMNAAGTNRIADAVVAGYWLPVPLVSDGFSTNGTSDGLGHVETSGIGSGGSGIAWSGTTWSVSGGKAINTPVPGSELLADGGFENWTTSVDAASWIENIAGASTINRDSVSPHSGTYAIRMDIDASISAAYVTQTTSAPVGTWARASVWIKSSSNTTVAMRCLSGVSVAKNVTTMYTEYVITDRAVGGAFSMLSRGSTAASVSIWFDDFSIKPLPLSNLLSLHTSSIADTFFGADLTVTAGTQAGLALNWDSSSSPANGVVAYHDGTNCKLEKCVVGTWTSVISAAATYSAGARLVVSKIGTTYRLYYNNALVGSGTISDAGIVSNTKHGLFSTYEGNTLDNYTCYASGTGGEYATAFDIVIPASGASAGVGDSTANATRKRTAIGTSAGAGDSTANATRKRTVSGVSAGVGGANGTSVAKRLVSGQSNGTSNATGAISVRRNVSGQSDGVGSASATSSRKRTTSGASAGRGTATVHNYTVSATISS